MKEIAPHLFHWTAFHEDIGQDPDSLMGDDPSAVKRGLRQAISELLEQPFGPLLLAHGRPFVTGGKDALRAIAGRQSGGRRKAA